MHAVIHNGMIHDNSRVLFLILGCKEKSSRSLSQHTQPNLEKRVIGDDDCKYNLVTVLGTVQVTYVQRVSWKDCLVVADSLVKQHPFLKDPVNIYNIEFVNLSLN